MPQHGSAGFTLGFLLDMARQLIDIADMLGDCHNRVFFTFVDAGFDFTNQIFTVELNFRQHDELATAGNRRRQRQIAAITPHHFNDRNTLM
ncbi:hypothetical protein D3C78_1357730 [compost metagenome]